MAVDTIFSFKVKDEELFKSYLDKVLPVTENEEPYVLLYDIFKDTDGIYYQHERYTDEDAVWKHMEVTASGQKDFAESTEMLSLKILGEVSDKFRETFGIKEKISPFKSIKR